MPRTPLMLEVQITKEYTHLVYLGPLYEDVLQSDTHARGAGSTVADVVDAEGTPRWHRLRPHCAWQQCGGQCPRVAAAPCRPPGWRPSGRAGGGVPAWQNAPSDPRRYALPPGLLKAGANTVVVNVLDTYGEGGLAGPASAHAVELADHAHRPGWHWQYRQSVGALACGLRHVDAVQRHDRAAGALRAAWHAVVPGRIQHRRRRCLRDTAAWLAR
ncbi:hypothetical protein NB693_24720 [Pantoea ananatis]|nr:hypothetical protein [Pantoea ananatis]